MKSSLDEQMDSVIDGTLKSDQSEQLDNLSLKAANDVKLDLFNECDDELFLNVEDSSVMQTEIRKENAQNTKNGDNNMNDYSFDDDDDLFLNVVLP